MSGYGYIDYYGLLGVDKSADISDIHKAYWRQACRCHPDRGGSNEAMLRIAEAWGILSDPLKRARYDQLLASQHVECRHKEFMDDLRESRIKAYKHARSWAEFEKIYLKASETFRKDLDHTDLYEKGPGPYKIRLAGGSETVWIFNCTIGGVFVVSPTLTKAASQKPEGLVILFIFIIAMFIGLGLGALTYILLG